MTTADQALFAIPAQPSRPTPAAPTSALPPWLATRIAQSTGIDPLGSHTRTARPRPCPTCTTWTLQGLDNDICARPATATAQPLNDQGVTIAILTGLTVWRLHNLHQRLQLEQLDAYRNHADRMDLVAEHACHIDLSSYAAPSRLRTTTTERLPAGALPPF